MTGEGSENRTITINLSGPDPNILPMGIYELVEWVAAEINDTLGLEGGERLVPVHKKGGD